MDNELHGDQPRRDLYNARGDPDKADFRVAAGLKACVFSCFFFSFSSQTHTHTQSEQCPDCEWIEIFGSFVLVTLTFFFFFFSLVHFQYRAESNPRNTERGKQQAAKKLEHISDYESEGY